MFAYIVVLIILVFPLIHYRRHQASEKNSKYFYLEFIVMACLMGFRYRVGGDSIRYENLYLYQSSLTELATASNWWSDGYQPLWTLLSAICKSISDEFWVFQICQAFIVNGIVFYCANRYCKYRYTFVLVYFLTYYLYFNAEIMREALAVSVFMFSFKYLVSHRYGKYYIFCLIAFMFHASAFILFFLPPIYKIVSKRRGVPLYLTILSLSFVVILSADVIIYLMSAYLFSGNSLILDRLFFLGESNGLNFFGIAGKIIFLLPVIITQRCLWSVRDLNTDANNFISSMYIIFSIIAVVITPLSRLENYFSILFLIIFVNFICSYTCRKYFRSMISISILIFSISQVRWYSALTHSIYKEDSDFRRYERYIPYHSIIDKEKEPEREHAIRQEDLKVVSDY